MIYLSYFFIFLSFILTSSNGSKFYTEQFRNQIVFSPKQNFMNDPNGLIYFQNQFHMYFQYNPFSSIHANMSWGHAVSNDLIFWQELPVAIGIENKIQAFSGSTFFDKHNRAGFESPALLAFYTGFNETAPHIQNQRLAYSVNGGKSFLQFKNNPIIDRNSTSFRDPNIFKYNDKYILVTVLSDEHLVLFYSSKDFKQWHLESKWNGPTDQGIYECPDLVQIPSQNGNSSWVLILNIGQNSEKGSFTSYFIGDFNGTHFIDDQSGLKVADFGRDFYAAVTFHDFFDERNEPVWIGWMSNWLYANDVPTNVWRGQMTLPRSLRLLPSKNNSFLLQQQFTSNLTMLIEKTMIYNAKMNVNDWLKTSYNQMNSVLFVELQLKKENNFEMNVSFENKQTKIIISFINSTLSVDRRNSGFNLTSFIEHSPFIAPFPQAIDTSTLFDMQMIIDHSSIQIIAMDGLISSSNLIFSNLKSVAPNITISNGDELIKSMKISNLKSIWSNNTPDSSSPTPFPTFWIVFIVILLLLALIVGGVSWFKVKQTRKKFEIIK